VADRDRGGCCNRRLSQRGSAGRPSRLTPHQTPFLPLVWAAAETFDLVQSAALPLALYRERSVCREAALAALNDNELTWEIIYTCPSLTGVRAAALAGLAISPLPASALIAGLRILGVEEGLPPLPDLEFAIYEKARPDKAAAALAAVLLTLGPGLSRPAI
jgi:DNA-binding transcriptional LysR family regulator